MLHIIKIDCQAIPSCAGRDDVVSIRVAQDTVTLTLETVAQSPSSRICMPQPISFMSSTADQVPLTASYDIGSDSVLEPLKLPATVTFP